MDNILNQTTCNISVLENNFYKYINQEWLDNTKLKNYDTIMSKFSILQDKVNIQIENIILSNKIEPAKKLYDSFMNIELKSKNSEKEIKIILKLLTNIKSYNDLIKMATILLFFNIETIFSININIDIYNSNNYILYLTQPSFKIIKEYYENNDILEKYKLYIDTILEKFNINNNNILNIERELNKFFLSKTEEKNCEKNYKKKDLSNYLENNTKHSYISIILNKLKNLSNIKIEHFIMVCSDENNYFTKLADILKQYSLDDWKIFLKFKIIDYFLPFSNDELSNIHYNMYNKYLNGQITKKKINKLATKYTSTYYSDIISYIYNKIYLDNATILYLNKMIDNIKSIIIYRVKKKTWLLDETKNKIIDKINSITVKLGYSDCIHRHYPKYMYNSLIKNILILDYDHMLYNLRLLLVNNTKIWDIESYSVNAYYSCINNEIIFPTAILQPPFIDLNKSIIYNYANIGTIIGHEIIHSLDDNGSLFDKHGNLNSWWTDYDKKEYNKLVDNIKNIYKNGDLTSGENIADLAALDISLEVLIKYYKINIDQIKEYFKEYAISNRTIIRKENSNIRALSDYHADSEDRTNNPIKHNKLFQLIYNLKEGNKMYVDLKDIVKIW